MRSVFQLLAALPLAAAFPRILNVLDANEGLVRRGQTQGVQPKVPRPKFSSGRDQCGVHGPCAGFNAADQFVNVAKGSAHEFQAPGPGDLRGECPGLNAAANHGFLPRNGIPNIQQSQFWRPKPPFLSDANSRSSAILGLSEAYNMAPDLSGVLAVISIAVAGDPIAQTWSIGGSFPASLGLLGTPSGILGTHNRYEGDASIVRGDAYLYKGNVDFFQMQKWNYLYSLASETGSFTSDLAARMAYYTTEYSVLNNPIYFSGPFSGLVAPDAHNFVTNLMSNHSAQVPGGTLTPETLMSFFAVTGTPGKFVHHQYQERIPYNWYRRPTLNAFTAVDTNADTVINNEIYPGVIKFGGNTGKKNSFAGVDFASLTGGVYNSKNLLTGDNLSCFFMQAAQQGLLDFDAPLIEPLASLQALLDTKIAPQLKALNCPQLKAFNDTLFNDYPGAKYKAEGE